jgi:hypothetical protein
MVLRMPSNPGIVHQYIQPSAPLCGLGQGLAPRGICDICLHHLDL